ncbi:MAG: D-aminoacylase [Acidobacteria bacterium]|nr:D-aminoacylase [Acidobacteriota bacterium]
MHVHRSEGGTSRRSAASLRRAGFAVLCLPLLLISAGCARERSSAADFDLILRGGNVYDGTGAPAAVADVAIHQDTIAAIGDLSTSTGLTEIDVNGLAVAPGFINMLSWSTDSLILDGLSQSEIRQGVTLQIFGEGMSWGPVNDAVKRNLTEQRPPEIDFEITWTTLGEYLEHLESRGVSTNVASFVGATTVRIYTLGSEDRPPNEEELEAMRALVRQAMEEGALGVGSSLIYAPAFYADTDELIELAKVAATYGGMYISHIRSEGGRLLEAVDELIRIARESGAPAEIYHFKAAGRSNWDKLDAAIEKVEEARADGLRITADMYTYSAAATGLDAAMPPWVQEGGFDAWVNRLRDPAIRRRVVEEMTTHTDAWENLFFEAGPDKMLLVGFRNKELRPLSGRTLADIAAERNTSPAETAIDLVIEDGSRVGTVYFLMSEENIARKTAIPWMGFGSDEASQAPEGIFLEFMPHPRAYGTFARLLGKYVRDEGRLSLEEAIRRLTSFPAANLGLRQRGTLKTGSFADIVVFDPAAIRDHATFDEPHQYATGMLHVFVNGRQVLKDGEHTGATPGRVVRGPGWTGWRSD